MQFKKFSSLENTYKQNLLDKVQYEDRGGGLWIATEKLAGANFSFWCDGTEVKVASRTQFVDGTFFNCQAVVNLYSCLILEWCKFNGVTNLTIYGELFGGNIQNRVKYGEKDFRAFDVVIDGVVQGKLEAYNTCESVGVPFAPIIKAGTLSECLALSNTFNSYFTPYGYEGDNIAEGLVIEPVEPSWFNNGSRIYFKNKSPSFSERQVREKQVFELSEDESSLMNDVLAYCNEQRVQSVISKIGVVTSKEFGKILGLTMQDMLEDFTSDTGKDIKKEAENNYKHFSKILSNEVGKTVRGVFVTHLD